MTDGRMSPLSQDLLDYGVSQQNIVIQASQALNLSLNGEDRKGCPEIIEGERLLLLASKLSFISAA